MRSDRGGGLRFRPHWLRGYGGSGQYLVSDSEEQRAVLRVSEDVGEGLVGERGGGQDGVLGQAGPQAAEDVFGQLGVREEGGEEAAPFVMKILGGADQQRGADARPHLARCHLGG